MATATSLTTERILEIAAGWTSVEQAQADVAAMVIDLKTVVDENDQAVHDLTQTVIPTLQTDVAARDIAIGDIQDNAIPNLQQDVANQAADIVDINEVTIPGIQSNLDSIGSTMLAVGVPYRQAEPPLDDDPEFPILVGTRWYDEDDNQKEYVWDGTGWVEAGGTVADFSLTAQKFQTSTHMIY